MEQKALLTVAALMTVHNRRETTLSCLRQLSAMRFDRQRIRLDVFLTDDGCTDGTANAIQREFPGTRILEGDGSLYWNRGMHRAWEVAAAGDYDYYWWVNDDTLVFADTLDRMLSCSHGHEDQVLVVGSTGATDGSGTVTYGGLTKGKLLCDLSREQYCETMNGNLVLIPRSVFRTLGMNDPYYRHALGDTDYGLRATEAGIKCIVVPGLCGLCDLHERPSVWRDPSQPFKKRWAHFFSPTGNNPFEFFRYRRIHYGLLPAIGTFFSNFMHFFLPGLWKNRTRQNP